MLRKILKIIVNWLRVLKVPKALIVEYTEGIDWVGEGVDLMSKVPTG